VTDDPPTLLVCIKRSNRSYSAFRRNGVLCVNTLLAGQETLAAEFASGSVDDRFEHGAWSVGISGAPVLDGALVSFDCWVVETSDIGTHTVFYCRVLAVGGGAREAGLVYFDRGYHRVGHQSEGDGTRLSRQ
jgi:flavin reductase